MEIGSKAKKIIVWSASGLAAAGLLTGTFLTGMAVADNTEPASATSEIDGERPEPPQRGDHGDLPDREDARGNGTNDDDGGDGHHHGPGDGEEEAPAESAPSES